MSGVSPFTQEQLEIIDKPGVKGGVAIPEYVPLVKSKIDAVFKKSFNEYKQTIGSPNLVASDEISRILKENGAVISGGFMLYAVGLKPMSEDMDIYVSCKNLRNINTTIPKFAQSKIMGEFMSSQYCFSFLRKNGIRSVQTYHLNLYGSDVNNRIYHVDIMAVRNKRNPLDVVQNFDLTYCQLWYDGEMVYATHPEHVKNKIGCLQKEYVPLFIAGNTFLKERISKYSRHGFKTALAKDGLTDPTPIGVSNVNSVFCEYNKEEHLINLKKDDALMDKWSHRALFNFIISKTYSPVYSGKRKHLDEQPVGQNKYSIEPFGISDGYDSEDYEPVNDVKSLFPIAQEKAKQFSTDLEPLTPEEKFYHIANMFLEMIYSENSNKNPFVHFTIEGKNVKWKNDGIFPEDNQDNEFTDSYFNPQNKPMKYFEPYRQYLKKYILNSRVGEDFFGGEGTLYDLHAHPLEGGITTESLETYLTDKIGEPDKNNIPCYWKGQGCTKPLTLDQVRVCVSPEFFKRYNTGGKGKIESNIKDIVKDTSFLFLENVKTSTDSWGELYHTSICPFCLVPDGRDKGCAYLSHENKTAAPPSASPYCNNKNKINEIFNKYRRAATLIKGDRTKLEYCVECGRPCAGHSHFDLNFETPGILPHRVRRGPDQIPDYAVCDGGGRAELFARILAMRKVLQENPDMDPKELRELAANAALKAPLDEELMQKGRAILETEPEERKWGNALDDEENSNNYTERNEENFINRNNFNQLGGNTCSYCKESIPHQHKRFSKTIRKNKLKSSSKKKSRKSN